MLKEEIIAAINALTPIVNNPTNCSVDLYNAAQSKLIELIAKL